MSTPEEATGSHHDPLDAVIAAYLQQVEAGAVPDREALLAQHPELAEGLREFFADFDRLDRQAGELHLPGAPESAGERPHVRYFGEYELLEVIARGGMGVVYKARQQSLNRLVALKMILQGQLATPRAVARFRAEAEAAANLDHPHIVPIYEVGEHEGQQYFTMRFIEGTSLARHARGDLRSEVRLLATVARAVNYAHQQGILHRDLKPSNILVAGGVPFVTDFGLAKRLDGAGDLTGTDETPGTPRYMAPEQAAGRKDLTVAADVYSLGVVLYERLTGATPFKGDDLLDVLRQVREVVPPRPSSVRPGLDRDLETVCLKCLEKEPAKRYPSAEALADDLERWLRGEPILARPVGSLGRLTRWGRRNPVVAGLIGAVAVSLVVGTVIATYFAVQAERRASAEKAERERAQAAEDDLEQALARSLVRPLDSRQGRSLSRLEMEALWELAGTTNERLRWRTLEEALRNESTVEQLRNRAECFIHATLGMDRQRRARAEQLLVERMNDPQRCLRYRTEIAWACLELAEWGSLVQHASTEVIIQGWTGETNAELRSTWQNLMTLTAGAEQIAPDAAAQLLSHAMEHERSYFRSSVASGLAKVAEGWEPAEAARYLNHTLRQEADPEVQLIFAQRLAAVAGRLEPAEATRVGTEAARLLSQALGQAKDFRTLRYLAESVAAVAGLLEPAEATHVCTETARLLSQALADQKASRVRYELAKALAAVAEHLEPTEAARVFNRTLGQAKDSYGRGQLARVFAAGRVAPAAATQVCTEAARFLSQELRQAEDSRDAIQAARELAAVTERLEPAEASRIGAEIARTFLRAVEQNKDFQTWCAAAVALATVARRLEPAEASRLCTEAARLLSKTLGQEQEDRARWELAQALGAVADLIEANEAVQLLSQALAQESENTTRKLLATGLASAAQRLAPAEAARLLVRALERESKLDAGSPDVYAKSLAVVARRLEPAEATRVCTEAARILSQALKRPADDARGPLAEGLAAVASCLEPAEATRVCTEAARFFLRDREVRSQDGTYREEELLRIFLPFLESDKALNTARALVRRLASEGYQWNFGESGGYGKVLDHLLTFASQPHFPRRRTVVAAAVASAANGPLASLPFLPESVEPFPCSFPSQDLVDLLKMPTCVGKARRIILDYLRNRYHRRFNTHWDFVRYAQEQGLNLDFTTPPKRPDPKLPPLFEP
jgi:tRNA A-37 threonylcarbamoyl transferase component Bud32